MDKKQIMSMILKLKSELGKLESMVMGGEMEEPMEDIGEEEAEMDMDSAPEEKPQSNKKAGIVAMLKKKAGNL